MRRLLLPAAAVALLVAAAVLAVLALAPRSGATAAERVQALAGEMRCPDCQALSVAESRTQAALAIRAEIERQVAAGRTDDQVRDDFVASYGEWILLAPSEPLVWVLPAIALLAGVALLTAWFGVGRSGIPGSPAAPPQVGEADRRRIHEELEALDG